MSTTENTEKKPLKLYGAIAFISLVVTVLLIIYASEWFWLGLPFLFTYAAKSLDVM